ncbi:hypothetical protein PHISCL_09606 [Aspergillus sclerotialis]|uniref:Uncharacterized protein n=1 Tax=Aspergillus sclerotialis TaxID=2070753 RepID=A0A3A2ZFG3_9EURO|nr:hypothetical protein PHISCL_09606 [Aspergillus sclerotialis]
MPPTVRAALLDEIQDVGDSLGYNPKWCNDEITWFLTLLDNPNHLFDRSMAQDVRLFMGQNLHVRAVLWDWVLVCKLQRLQSIHPAKKEDLFDCAEITKILYFNRGGRLIGRDILQAFDDTDRAPPIFRSTAEIVGNYSRDQWGVFPFDLEGLPED